MCPASCDELHGTAHSQTSGDPPAQRGVPHTRIALPHKVDRAVGHRPFHRDGMLLRRVGPRVLNRDCGLVDVGEPKVPDPPPEVDVFEVHEVGLVPAREIFKDRAFHHDGCTREGASDAALAVVCSILVSAAPRVARPNLAEQCVAHPGAHRWNISS